MTIKKKQPVRRTKRNQKAGQRRAKGSTRFYGKYSGMTPKNTLATNAGVQVFTQVASNIGDQASEGDIFRLVTNTHATLTIQLGETQAQAIGANGYKLLPGHDLMLLGPSGIGWAGTLWIFETTGAATLSSMEF